MKYAVITDVHSNLHALKAVLKEIDGKVDKIICLGDIVGNGFYPEECVNTLRRREDVIFVKGNHDAFLTLDLSTVQNGDGRLDIFRWQQKIISSSVKDFLKDMKGICSLMDNGKKIVCVHYPKNEKGRFKNLVLLPSESEVKELFDGLDGDIFLFGHEHTGSMHVIDGKYYLNFGTLGNLLEKDKAYYGIVEVKENGEVSYERRFALYDDEPERQKCEFIKKYLVKNS